MNKIVKALRVIGYQVIVARLNEEDKAVWSNMVASATSQQQAVNLLTEDKAVWDCMVVEEELNSSISIR